MQSAFNNIEQDICVVTEAMGYPFSVVCNTVIAQLHGYPALMVRDIVGKYSKLANLNSFLARLRQIYHTHKLVDDIRIMSESKCTSCTNCMSKGLTR